MKEVPLTLIFPHRIGGYVPVNREALKVIHNYSRFISFSHFLCGAYCMCVCVRACVCMGVCDELRSRHHRQLVHQRGTKERIGREKEQAGGGFRERIVMVA